MGLLYPALIIRAFALSYCVLFCPVWLSSLGGLLLSKEETEVRGVDLGGREELGGVERRETVVRIYCVRKEPISN